jgi:hypothetical protein
LNALACGLGLLNWLAVGLSIGAPHIYKQTLRALERQPPVELIGMWYKNWRVLNETCMIMYTFWLILHFSTRLVGNKLVDKHSQATWLVEFILACALQASFMRILVTLLSQPFKLFDALLGVAQADRQWLRLFLLCRPQLQDFK